MPDRVVIGGGFSGMLAALRAAEAGESVVLLEGSHQLGGAIRGVSIDGVVVDAGAESFSVVAPHFQDLLEHWGLGDDIAEPAASSAHIVLPDRTIPIPRGVMGIPAGADELRRSGALDGPDIDQTIVLDSTAWDVPAGASVAQVVRSRLGEAVYQRIVGPVVSGVWGVAGEQLDAQTVFPELLALAEKRGSLLAAAQEIRGTSPAMGQAVRSLRGGLHRLVPLMERMLIDHGVDIRRHAQVQSVRETGGLWQLDTEYPVQAPQISIAVGPQALNQLLGPMGKPEGGTPGVSATPSRVALVSLDAPELELAPWGTGALVAESVPGGVKAFTHVNAKWSWWSEQLPAGRHLLRFSLRDTDAPHGAVRGAIEQALSQFGGVAPQAIREVVIVEWPDVLSRPEPSSDSDGGAFVEHWASRGVELLGAALPGSGLLRYARHHLSHRQKEEHRVAIG